jgi:hypothetical protein
VDVFEKDAIFFRDIYLCIPFNDSNRYSIGNCSTRDVQSHCKRQDLTRVCLTIHQQQTTLV